MHTAAIYISRNIATDITDAHKKYEHQSPISIVEEMQERKENEHIAFFTTLNVILKSQKTQTLKIDRSFKSNPLNQISIVINRND